MTLLDNHAWQLPARLDRLLPDVDIEGATLPLREPRGRVQGLIDLVKHEHVVDLRHAVAGTTRGRCTDPALGTPLIT